MKFSVLLLLAAASIGLWSAATLAGPAPEAPPHPLSGALRHLDLPILSPGAGTEPAALFEVKPVAKNRAAGPWWRPPPLPLDPLPPGTTSWALTNFSLPHTNVHQFVRRLPACAFGHKPIGAPIAPPGVYESEPYKCLIVVPGRHLDDRCLIPGGGPTEPMPMPRPKLWLIPRGK